MPNTDSKLKTVGWNDINWQKVEREEDHVLATALGGKDIYDNLQLLHGHCHDEKTAQDLRLIREHKLLKLIGNDWYWDENDFLRTSQNCRVS